MTRLTELQSSQWRLSLAPAQGLQIMSAQVRLANQWVDVMPDCRRSDSALPAASFHMLPYSNRIRDGRFGFQGQNIQLQHPDPHAIHGAVRTLPWALCSEAANALSASVCSGAEGTASWPWPITVEASYAVAGDLLISELILTNRGDTPMPAGLGWHPYFCRSVLGAAPRLQLPASGVYPDSAGDCLPTGAAQALPPALDFNQLRALEPDQRIDHCLAGFGGAALIAWPDAGLSLVLEASEACGHAVLYNPSADHFAVEPVTHANDGFNLHERGIEAGVQVLEPDESLAATMSLTVRRDGH